MDTINENRPFDAIPFSADRGEGMFATLLEIKDNPNFIIKEIPPDENGSLEIEKIRKQTRKTAGGFEWALDVKNHLEISRSDPKLSSFIPDNYIVYGSDAGGGKRVFIVMEKVHGLELADANPTADEFMQLGNLINTSLDFYYQRKTTLPSGKSRSYFPDIVQCSPSGDGFLTNIMIGKTRRDETSKVYLVDNYPLLYFDGVDGELKMLRNLAGALYWYDYNIFNKWWEDKEASPPPIDADSFEDWFKTKASPAGIDRQYPFLVKSYFRDHWFTNKHPWVSVYAGLLSKIDKLVAKAEEDLFIKK